MRKETARDEYDRLHEAVHEETKGSEVGFGFFLTQSGITEERPFIAKLLAGVNKPEARQAFWDYLDGRIEQYAQLEADARQFGQGRFPPGPRSQKFPAFKDAREVAAAAFRIPQTKE